MKFLAIKFKFLGDIALTIPALRALKEYNPDAEIHFLVPEHAFPVVQHNPWIRKVWAFPKKRGLKALENWGLIRDLRKEKFDVSIDFVGNDRGALISLLVGAEVRLGPKSTRGFLGREYCYSHRISEASENLHEIDRSLNLLKKIHIPAPSSKQPELYSDPGLNNYASKILPCDSILCHISTSSDSKEWPIENWVSFYKNYPELSAHMVFTSGISEREKNLLETLRKYLPEAKTISPSPTLPELMALIKQARLVICGDTFTAHAAAGLGTPLVALYGPTRVEQWDPLGKRVLLEAQNCKCRHFFYKCTAQKHCLLNLSAKSVANAVVEILNKTSNERKIANQSNHYCA